VQKIAGNQGRILPIGKSRNNYRCLPIGKTAEGRWKSLVEIVDAGRMAWIPTAVAKRMLGISKQRVYQLVASGALAACRVQGTLFISRRSIEDRLEMHLREED
jgi:hypothetical protein